MHKGTSKLPCMYYSSNHWTRGEIHNIGSCGNAQTLKISKTYLEHLKPELPWGGPLFRYHLPTACLDQRYVGWSRFICSFYLYTLYLWNLNKSKSHKICLSPIQKCKDIVAGLSKHYRLNGGCIYLTKVHHTFVLDFLDIHCRDNVLLVFCFIKHFIFSSVAI